MLTVRFKTALLTAVGCAALLAAEGGFAAGPSVTVQAFNARSEAVEVQVPADPKRVAVIDLAVLDMLDRWGLTDRVVALPQAASVPHLEKYFKKSDKMTDIGTMKEIHMEGLMASEPDVIFISGRLSKKYAELERIAPVVYLTPQRSSGFFERFETNVRSVARIFGREKEAEADLAGFRSRAEAVRRAAEGKTALISLVTSAHVNLLGDNARCSMIGNEFGFRNLSTGAKATHGNESSFELLLKHNPDFFFVLDRDSAIGRPGAKLAADILDNDLVKKMKAYKDGRIVYLTPSVWYLAEGGITAMDIMLKDVEGALGIRTE